MNCLKCGKETKENQVFCPHCLDVMKDYPIKSDTPVHLPSRTPKPPSRRRKFKHRIMSAEEQLQHSKKAVRSLLALVLLLTLVVVYWVLLLHTPSERKKTLIWARIIHTKKPTGNCFT